MSDPSPWALERARKVKSHRLYHCFCSQVLTCGDHTAIALALDEALAEHVAVIAAKTELCSYDG